MNIPGTASGNWQWRLEEKALAKKLAAKLNHEIQTFNRALGGHSNKLIIRPTTV